MKQKLVIATLAIAVAMLSAADIQAQTYGGAVLDHDILMPADIASLSKTQVFGTSRAMAMGGAFTSLGADMSSASINPAGLGMYSLEVFSFTPMISSANSSTVGTPSWVGNNKTSMSMANMGGVFKVTENASGSLIAVNAAITYNRVADYNTRMSFSKESLFDSSNGNYVPSINDVFMRQLDGGGIYPTDTSKTMEYDGNPYYWSAQSAYNTVLIDPESGNNGWTTNTIGYNASVLGSYEVLQSGRTDEYTFALGANIGNYLYMGATLGIHDIRQTTEYTYQEEYNYYDDDDYAYGSPSDTEPLSSQAIYSSLWQRTKLSGSGIDLKLGLIARPTRAIRIGAAFHSPTYYNLARTYETSTEAKFWDNSDNTQFINTSLSPEFIDDYENSWSFRTPSKLLLGASFQVGSVGLVAVDYERQWYNWMRVSSMPTGTGYSTYDYQQTFEESYQPTNTLRVGIEVKPVATVALRAGGGFSTSMLTDEAQMYSTPLATDSNYMTFGLGFQLSATTTFDLAYQYFHQNYSSYRLFYVENGGEMLSASNLFNSSLDANYFTLTFTFRL
ncbi:MAG: transporter [Rikenellaceae bacterium]